MNYAYKGSEAMNFKNPENVHDIGIVTSTGSTVSRPSHQGLIKLAQGSTDASVAYLPNCSIQAEVTIADGPTAAASIGIENKIHLENGQIIHNPMIAFWRRAVLYYETKKQQYNEGLPLRFEHYALIISDLGQSLYMLFGRHWNEKAKRIYSSMVGKPPDSTPDLLPLLVKYYPPIGWDLPSDNIALWNLLYEFILNYYQDIVKHFEYRKFEKALSLDTDKLARFMEITRKSWIWFIEKLFDLNYDTSHEAFKYFTRTYHELE